MSSTQNPSGFLLTAILLYSAAGLMTVLEDERVTIYEIPAAVRKTIEEHVDGSVIWEIERTMNQERVMYEVVVLGENGMVEFGVREDGTIVGFDGDRDRGEDRNSDGDGTDTGLADTSSPKLLRQE